MLKTAAPPADPRDSLRQLLRGRTLDCAIGDATGNIQRQPMCTMQDSSLTWTKLWPHERIKRRLTDAGFSDRDIEAALTGRARLWQEDR